MQKTASASWGEEETGQLGTEHFETMAISRANDAGGMVAGHRYTRPPLVIACGAAMMRAVFCPLQVHNLPRNFQ